MKLTLVLALLVLGIGMGVLIRSRKANRDSHERDGLTRFRQAYAGRGFSDPLLSATYHFLAERDAAANVHYEVLPADNLQRVYGLVDLDLEDAVLVIADKAGARLPNAHDLDAVKGQVHTVDELLVFLSPYFGIAPANS